MWEEGRGIRGRGQTVCLSIDWFGFFLFFQKKNFSVLFLDVVGSGEGGGEVNILPKRIMVLDKVFLAAGGIVLVRRREVSMRGWI